MIILRQKQYSPGFSGIKRVLKKNIDNARMKLAKKLDKSIEKDLIEKNRFENLGTEFSDRLRERTITTEAAKSDIAKRINSGERISRTHAKNPYIENGELILPNPISSGELYHEIGHIENASGNNGKIPQFISKHGQTPENLREVNVMDLISSDYRYADKAQREELLKNSPETLKELNESLENKKPFESIKRFIKGKTLVRDERNASRWGLKKTREKINDPEVLSLEEQRQKAANETYNRSILASSKIPLRNSIQIPSKRGNFKFDKLKEEYDKRNPN